MVLVPINRVFVAQNRVKLDFWALDRVLVAQNRVKKRVHDLIRACFETFFEAKKFLVGSLTCHLNWENEPVILQKVWLCETEWCKKVSCGSNSLK